MKFSIAVLTTLVLAACHKSAVPFTNGCKEFLKSADKISVCFDRIIQDSRCPPDVDCVWEGYALVQFQFKKNGITTPIQLSTMRRPGIPAKDTILQGYKVELLSFSDVTKSAVPKFELSITQQ